MSKLPNVLVLMTDQQRWDCLSSAGHPQIKTPNMDRIASTGVRFSQAITVSPVCMPARASFINSLYPHNHGMWNNRGCMPAHDDTFFQHLQLAGYCTAYIGKSHYYGHGRGHLRDYEGYLRARGLEHVHEVTGPLATQRARSYMTDYLEERGLYDLFKADYAERGALRRENPFFVRQSPLPVDSFLDSYVGRTAEGFIGSYRDQRPLCLFVGFPGPHEPWDAPGEYAAMYKPEATPKPVPWSDSVQLPQQIREMEDFQPMGSSTAENIKQVRANYYGKVSLIDHWVGRLLDTCEDRGMLDETVTVFWSDHGDMLGDHRRVFKSTFFESSMRVPLMISWPDRVPRGLVSDALAEIIDVYPTLMDGLGLEAAPRCQGRSLLPAIEGDGSDLRSSQLSEVKHADERRICLRTRDHKYAVRQDGTGFMLYDLQKDPTEQLNLIGKDPDLEARLREDMFRRLLGAQYSMQGCRLETGTYEVLRSF